MSRGFLMFAHNNEQIDYGLIALCNGLMIRDYYPDAGIALVTDAGTLNWLIESRGQSLVDSVFTHIIVEETDNSVQKRRYLDTISTAHELPWHNKTRVQAYGITPFEETIMLDSDYLIGNDSLKHCWGSRSDIRMNKQVVTLDYEQPHMDERRLEPFGIAMYWATCVYFTKSEVSETFFNLVEHVKDNYDYYQHIYRFPGVLYRNDYAFSIAAHIMSGWEEGCIDPLPVTKLLTSFDWDELVDVPTKGDFVFLVNDQQERWKFTFNRTSGLNVHVMNKFSIGRNAEKILALYGV